MCKWVLKEYSSLHCGICPPSLFLRSCVSTYSCPWEKKGRKTKKKLGLGWSNRALFSFSLSLFLVRLLPLWPVVSGGGGGGYSKWHEFWPEKRISLLYCSFLLSCMCEHVGLLGCFWRGRKKRRRHETGAEAGQIRCLCWDQEARKAFSQGISMCTLQITESRFYLLNFSIFRVIILVESISFILLDNAPCHEKQLPYEVLAFSRKRRLKLLRPYHNNA